MYVCMSIFIKLLFESYRYIWTNESNSVSSFSRIYFSLFLYWLNKKKMCRLTLWTIVIRLYEKKRKEEERTIFFLSLCHFLFTPAIQPKKIDNEIWHLFLFFLIIKKETNHDFFSFFFNLYYSRYSIFFILFKALIYTLLKSVS